MSTASIYLILWCLFWGAMLGSCVLAFWKGGPAERWGAGLILIFALLWEVTRFLSDEWKPIAQLVGDGLTAVGLLAIAVRYASLWLGGALLFQAAQFSLHPFYFVTHRPQDSLHIIINNTNLFAILACLIIGSLMTWRERKKAERAILPPTSAATTI